MQRMFANALKHFRKEKGLTQAIVAKRAGIAQSEVSRLEDGYHWPSYTTILRLIEAVETDEKSFFYFMAHDILSLPQRVWNSLLEDRENRKKENNAK